MCNNMKLLHVTAGINIFWKVLKLTTEDWIFYVSKHLFPIDFHHILVSSVNHELRLTRASLSSIIQILNSQFSKALVIAIRKLNKCCGRGRPQ